MEQFTSSDFSTICGPLLSLETIEFEVKQGGNKPNKPMSLDVVIKVDSQSSYKKHLRTLNKKAVDLEVRGAEIQAQALKQAKEDKEPSEKRIEQFKKDVDKLNKDIDAFDFVFEKLNPYVHDIPGILDEKGKPYSKVMLKQLLDKNRSSFAYRLEDKIDELHNAEDLEKNSEKPVESGPVENQNQQKQ